MIWWFVYILIGINMSEPNVTLHGDPGNPFLSQENFLWIILFDLIKLIRIEREMVSWIWVKIYIEWMEI